MTMLWANGHHGFQKKLSPYIDGKLSPRETAALEAHLHACEQCALELAELRQTVAALRGLPPVSPPRSFAIRPEQLGERRPAPAPSFPPLAAGMRIAAAGLAVALAAVVVLDLSGGERSGPSGDAMSGVPDAFRDANMDLAAPSLEDSDKSIAVDEPASQAIAPTISPGPAAPSTGGSDTAGGPAAGGVGGPAVPTPAPESPEALPATGPDFATPAPVPTLTPVPLPIATLIPTPSPPGAARAAVTNGLPAETPSALAEAGTAGEPDNGVNGLLIAEIALAAALALAVAASLGLAYAGRRRRL